MKQKQENIKRKWNEGSPLKIRDYVHKFALNYFLKVKTSIGYKW